MRAPPARRGNQKAGPGRIFRATAGEDDFKRTFGDAYVGSIADESRIARMAVDSGVPISSIKKSSKIIKNLNTIIGSVTH